MTIYVTQKAKKYVSYEGLNEFIRNLKYNSRILNTNDDMDFKEVETAYSNLFLTLGLFEFDQLLIHVISSLDSTRAMLDKSKLDSKDKYDLIAIIRNNTFRTFNPFVKESLIEFNRLDEYMDKYSKDFPEMHEFIIKIHNEIKDFKVKEKLITISNFYDSFKLS